MTTHDLAIALAKQLEEEGVTYEVLERIIHNAKEETRKEVAKMKGADENDLEIMKSYCDKCKHKGTCINICPTVWFAVLQRERSRR